MANLFKSMLAAAQGLFQSKTVAAGTSDKIITPDTGYDALSSVTVQPTPSQSKSVTPSATSQTVTPDTGKLLSSVSVDAVSLQSKSVTATTTAQTVTSDSGYTGLSEVTVNPQSHSATYTPAANTSNNNMGTNHNYKYVDTSGMYIPSGTYSAGTYTTNGTKTISGLSNYAATSFTINVPTGITPSGNKALSYTTNGMTSGIDVTNYATVSVERNITPTKTLLWENTAPTASFAAQTIAFTGSISDYKYLEFQLFESTTSTALWSIMIDTHEFTYFTSKYPQKEVCLFFRLSSSAHAAVRRFQYISDNQIAITANSYVGIEGTNNKYNIPGYIYGIKF